MLSLKDTLNEAQWEAVTYCDGPSLVIAGAGSGKTRVLTYKIAYLIQQGLSPWNILALTFTNKAAKEMNDRIRVLLQEMQQDEATSAAAPAAGWSGRGLWSGTFHSIFARILRHEAPYIGFTSDFTIYDAADSRSLIKTLVKELDLDEKLYKPQTVAARISEAKNAIILPDDYVHDDTILLRDRNDGLPAVGHLYTLYCQRLKSANAMDFDDLLLNTYLLFRQQPEVCERYRQRFQYILVDEYQDTNTAQHRIVGQLTTPTSRICVVGDDAQSIYAFRGACIDNILGFQRQYPGARLIKLERNYRSTQTLVKAANSVIRHNLKQIPKEVYSEGEEGDLIQVISASSDKDEGMKVAEEVRRLRRHHRMSYDDFALLYRTNAQSRSLEEALRAYDIPYRIYGGLSFYQRKEIKDIIAYFRLISNPNDEESFKRILNYPARGIGATTMNKVLAKAADEGVTPWMVCVDAESYALNVNRGTLSKLQHFVDLITGFRARMAHTGAYEMASQVIRESGIYADIMSDCSPEGLSRQENMEELRNAIRAMEAEMQQETGEQLVPLTEYLSQVSLLTDADQHDDDTPRVTLMTVHAAKGLEFDAVFVTGLEDELFPCATARFYPKEMEEERRLFYVAITRAKRFCYLTYAKCRFRYGEVSYSDPSPFLREVDPDCLDDGRRPTWRTGTPRTTVSHTAVSTTPGAPSPRWRRAESTPSTVANTSAARAASSGAVQARCKVGDVIVHERFGRGTVKEISGEGQNAKALVDFEQVGVKNLLLKYARFKVV
jgi:DNA helicase-2/ATP-dependent DNA helicase PcrA